jgi:hypothetical protein
MYVLVGSGNETRTGMKHFNRAGNAGFKLAEGEMLKRESERKSTGEFRELCHSEVWLSGCIA